jgi:RNA polymerase sigma-70 factor (ECF subfamily)
MTDLAARVRRILDGDLDAYREIIVAYQSDVQMIMSALLDDRETARDLVQEAFIRAYQHLDRFDPARGDFRLWLRGIARHVAQGELRRRARELKRLNFYWEYLECQPSDAAAAAARADDLRRHVDACCEKLEGDAATAIAMRYRQGAPIEEIAQALNRSLDTARKLLSRARLLIRDCVEKRIAATA